MVRQAADRDKARSDFNLLREQLRDPLLTVLTIVLAFWMFVLAPLHHHAARDTNIIGFLLALAVAGALLVLSGKAIPALLMLFGLSLSAAAAWFRLHDPSPFDIVLNASAWIVMGLVLICVVGRAVFAPGRITFHRIMGAILLYLAIGLTFAALYAFVGVLSTDAFSGMAVKDSPTLSSTIVNNDPKPAVETIKNTLKIYPYVPGSYGTSMGTFLTGKGPLAPLSKPGELTFIEGTGLAMNTIPPNDFSYYEMLDALVQEQPAEALAPEIGGQFAAIGIVKGKKFNPDARMRKILIDAIAVANAAARTVSFRPRESEGFGYYSPTSKWLNPLFVGGYDFTRPPPEITKEGVKPYPYTGARTLDARTAFFYVATGVTPAMVMRLPEVGSQYLFAIFDSSGKSFDGAKTYKVTLPPKIPAAKFWSFTLYDNQTRSMLQTKQRSPRAGSQSFPSPAATPNPDGSTTVYFGPSKPDGVADGNWIETVPGKGWFTILRLYSPLESFFTKEWRPSEIELVDGK